jgi:hypothetical protein
MDQLERAVVQLWEAKRLAQWEDIAHGRLALLLLDNAAETSLRRTAETNLLFADMYDNMAYLLRDVVPGDEEGQKLKLEFEAAALSRHQKRQIERHFDSLVDHVFEMDSFALSTEFADCLKILHRYRNAAYHRDTVHADVLGPAVRIQFFLCCHLLKNERQMVAEISKAPASILEVFGVRPPEPFLGGAFNTATLASHVADRMLDELHLDHRGIVAALSIHLLARLAALDRDLAAIEEAMPLGVTRRTTLRLVQQAPREREDFEAGPSADFWTRPLPITEEVIEAWTVAAQNLRDIPVAHRGLREFAQIEEPLATIEEPVARFIEDIDREEQRRIDEARGK